MSAPPVTLHTIGFTQKRAPRFFGLLRAAGITVVVDTRLRPNSQLGRFAHGADLPWLLRELLACDYRHCPQMAPAEDLLRAWRRGEVSWHGYARRYKRRLRERNLGAGLYRPWWAAQRVCLLCSEHEPAFCHRRLLADYLRECWKGVRIAHL